MAKNKNKPDNSLEKSSDVWYKTRYAKFRNCTSIWGEYGKPRLAQTDEEFIIVSSRISSLGGNTYILADEKQRQYKWHPEHCLNIYTK